MYVTHVAKKYFFSWKGCVQKGGGMMTQVPFVWIMGRAISSLWDSVNQEKRAKGGGSTSSEHVNRSHSEIRGKNSQVLWQSIQVEMNSTVEDQAFVFL